MLNKVVRSRFIHHAKKVLKKESLFDMEEVASNSNYFSWEVNICSLLFACFRALRTRKASISVLQSDITSCVTDIHIKQRYPPPPFSCLKINRIRIIYGCFWNSYFRYILLNLKNVTKPLKLIEMVSENKILITL